MNLGNDERIKKVPDTGRRSRAMDDRRATESRKLSDDDRVQMFRDCLIFRKSPAIMCAG